ncbi:MAG: copper transport protein, partial [Frankiaceae bacterium]|nr:copper transport protein [Frankiaceae bacterium]
MFRRISAVLGLAVLVTMAAAAPASAHAVLLSTSPAPQSTVPAPPTSVILHFSEAVDVAFGAIRVYDVDGHRVDSSAVAHPGGDKSAAAIGVRRLAAGSYTVSWHVVSADGHPVRGGFAFYVQHPSAISSVATTPDQPPSRFVSWFFGASRLLVYAAFALLVGLAVVRRWVWTPSRRQHDVAIDATTFPRRFRRWFVGSLVALVTGMIGSLLCQTATVAGVSLLAAAKPSLVHAVLGTSYGRSWLVGAAAAVLLGGVVWALVRGIR